MLLLFLACTKVEQTTPPTLREMSLSLLQDFETDAAPDETRALVDWLDANIDTAPDGWFLEHLEAADVADMPHSDNAVWEEVLGAGVPALVRGTTAAYAQAATEADQSFADPATYIRWDRDLTDGTSSAFLADHAALGTWNVIEKGGPFGVVIPYEMHKDFRWVDDTLIALSVVPEEGWGEDGENGIIVGFTIEVWFDRGSEVVWYNASWTQIATVIGDAFPQDVQLKTFIDGTHDYFEGTEAHVMGED